MHRCIALIKVCVTYGKVPERTYILTKALCCILLIFVMDVFDQIVH